MANSSSNLPRSRCRSRSRRSTGTLCWTLFIITITTASTTTFAFQTPKTTNCQRQILPLLDANPLLQDKDRKWRRKTKHSNSPSTVLHASLLTGIDIFFQNSPYTAAALVCGFKASAADGVAQFQEWKEMRKQREEMMMDNNKNELLRDNNNSGTTDLYVVSNINNDASDSIEEEKEETVDVRRNVAFITYGALYQGLTQEFIYNHVYPIWFGTGTDFVTVFDKVAFSLLVQTTLLTLPSLYIIKSLIEQTSINTAFDKYWNDIQNQQLLQKFYLLWGPVLTLTFSVIPEQYRVTFIAAISFFWLIILSGISNNVNIPPEEKDELCLIVQDNCEFTEHQVAVAGTKAAVKNPENQERIYRRQKELVNTE